MLNSIRAKTIKFSEKKPSIGETLHDFVCGNDFLDLTPKAQATKIKQCHSEEEAAVAPQISPAFSVIS